MTGYNRDERELAYILSGEIYQLICNGDDAWIAKAHELNLLIQRVDRRQKRDSFRNDPRQAHATDDRLVKPL